MASATAHIRCVVCNKDIVTFLCRGCSQEFCAPHLADHLQKLNQQLDAIDVDRDLLRQTLTEHQRQAEPHPLIQQIDQWEHSAIEKVQQSAQEARTIVSTKATELMREMEGRLEQLTQQLKQSRKDNAVNESSLHRSKSHLEQLSRQLATKSNMSIENERTPLVHHITIRMSPPQALSSDSTKSDDHSVPLPEPPRSVSKVALRSHANGKFVCLRHGETSTLVAHRDSVSKGETFDLIHLDDKQVALKSHANGKYVCAEDAGNGSLVANRSEIDAWVTFELIDRGGGKIALRAVNKKYVCAEFFGRNVLVANRTKVERWETFDLVQQ